MLHILFVRSGNNGIDPISTNQGLSLTENGIIVSYYDIIGTGIWGYLGNIPRLRSVIRECKCDLVHAHYSLSGIVASLTFTKKVVCSLMGSDIYSGRLQLILVKFFSDYLWSCTIVKSNKSAFDSGLREPLVLPNGINLRKFRIIEKSTARKYLGWEEEKVVLFGSDPRRPEKNMPLLQEALDLIQTKSFSVKYLVNVDNSDVPYWMSASDVLVLTSKWEGSPNVIKEALACGCPVVATNVGDIPELLEGVEGCFTCDLNAADVADKLIKGLNFAEKHDRSDGRNAIAFLDETIIAEKLINIYKSVLNDL